MLRDTRNCWLIKSCWIRSTFPLPLRWLRKQSSWRGTANRLWSSSCRAPQLSGDTSSKAWNKNCFTYLAPQQESIRSNQKAWPSAQLSLATPPAQALLLNLQPAAASCGAGTCQKEVEQEKPCEDTVQWGLWCPRVFCNVFHFHSKYSLVRSYI